MIVSSFPIKLPKICVHTVLELPVGERPQRVTVNLNKDSIEVAKFELEVTDELFAQEAGSQYLTGGLTIPPLDP
jgi:hypothetical protein